MKKKPLSLKAILFDFDGTLTKPGALNFEAIRKALGCPVGVPILEFIESLPDAAEQARLLTQLDRFETDAAAGSEPNVGAEELIRWLRTQCLHVGIITRNSRRSVERALENFSGVTPADFDVLISRDDPASPKPSSHGILLAAQMLGVHAAEVLVVGDHLFDIEAGHRAGAPTVYLTNCFEAAGSPSCSDYTVSTLHGLRPIVRLGLPLPSGKLPNDLLAQFLQKAEIHDPCLLVQPGVGEDTAAVDVSDEEVLVLKSDPVTFVTDEISQYAVLVSRLAPAPLRRHGRCGSHAAGRPWAGLPALGHHPVRRAYRNYRCRDAACCFRLAHRNSTARQAYRQARHAAR